MSDTLPNAIENMLSAVDTIGTFYRKNPAWVTAGMPDAIARLEAARLTPPATELLTAAETKRRLVPVYVVEAGEHEAQVKALRAEINKLRQWLRFAGLNPDDLDGQGFPKAMPKAEDIAMLPAQVDSPLDRMPEMYPCSECSGTGRVPAGSVTLPCPSCNLNDDRASAEGPTAAQADDILGKQHYNA